MCPANFKPRNIFISAQISLILRFLLFFCDFYAFAVKKFIVAVVLYVILNASNLQLSYFEEKDWLL